MAFENPFKSKQTTPAPEVETKKTASPSVVILYLQKNEETGEYIEMKSDVFYDSFQSAKAAINQYNLRYARPVPVDANKSRIEKALSEMYDDLKRDEKKKVATNSKSEEGKASADPLVTNTKNSPAAEKASETAASVKAKESSTQAANTQDMDTERPTVASQKEDTTAQEQIPNKTVPQLDIHQAPADSTASHEKKQQETANQGAEKPDIRKPQEAVPNNTDNENHKDAPSDPNGEKKVAIGCNYGANKNFWMKWVPDSPMLKLLESQGKIIVFRGCREEYDRNKKIQDDFEAKAKTLVSYASDRKAAQDIANASAPLADAPSSQGTDAQKKPSTTNQDVHNNQNHGTSSTTGSLTAGQPIRINGNNIPQNNQTTQAPRTNSSNQATNSSTSIPGGTAYPNGYSTYRDNNRYEMQELTRRIDKIFARLDNVEGQIKQLSSANDIFGRRVVGKVDELGQYCSTAFSPLATTEQIAKKLRSLEEHVVDEFDALSGSLKDTVPTLETIQGKLLAMEDILAKKGVTIQREANPTSNDEKEIVNAQRLINRLVEGIVSMALEYAKNREAIENTEAAFEQIRVESAEKAKAEYDKGQKDAFVQILSKFADIDSFLENESNSLIAAVMRNAGLRQDDELRKGEVITISDDTYMSRAKGFEIAGQYRVVLSAYYFGDELVQMATVERISE